MKKFLLSFAALLVMSTTVQAGAVKNILMDAEDAIHSEFFKNERRVESITNAEFVTVNGKIGVKAEVETINPLNNYPQSWVCIVSFERVDTRRFEATNVDCR